MFSLFPLSPPRGEEGSRHTTSAASAKMAALTVKEAMPSAVAARFTEMWNSETTATLRRERK